MAGTVEPHGEGHPARGRAALLLRLPRRRRRRGLHPLHTTAPPSGSRKTTDEVSLDRHAGPPGIVDLKAVKFVCCKLSLEHKGI